jgi:fatty-acyl-CoA synthase
MKGGVVCLRRRFDPQQLVRDVKAGRANSAFLVPTMIYMLLDELRGNADAIAGLELLLYGGSAISPSRLSESVELLGPALNQSYGQTEAPNTITILRSSEHERDLLGSSGMPYAGVTLAIRNAGKDTAPVGEIGEICVRGPQLMSGYLHLAAQSADALRDGWLWTGDRGYLDDRGYLFHAGRSKDMIISGGYNIYPSEVEAVLDGHRDVAASVVVGVPDKLWGEAVTAMVVRRSGEVTEQELRSLVRSEKGPMHVPKRFEFVELLPQTPLGKPDREQIRTRLASSTERVT